MEAGGRLRKNAKGDTRRRAEEIRSRKVSDAVRENDLDVASSRRYLATSSQSNHNFDRRVQVTASCFAAHVARVTFATCLLKQSRCDNPSELTNGRDPLFNTSSVPRRVRPSKVSKGTFLSGAFYPARRIPQCSLRHGFASETCTYTHFTHSLQPVCVHPRSTRVAHTPAALAARDVLVGTERALEITESSGCDGAEIAIVSRHGSSLFACARVVREERGTRALGPRGLSLSSTPRQSRGAARTKGSNVSSR